MPSPSGPSRPHVVIPIVAGIGNALMTVPMVRQLKRGLPDARITIAARLPAMGQVFDRLPAVDEVRILGASSIAMARGMFQIRRHCRPDIFVIPFPSNRWQYMMLALASGARRRVLHGYPVGYISALGFVPANRLPAVRHVHDVVQNLHLLRNLGINPDLTDRPYFPVTDADRQSAEDLLASVGIAPATRPIALHPGSARTILATAKRWPPQCYAGLVEKLQDHGETDIIVLEGPDEAGVGDEIARATQVPVRILRLAGPLGHAAAVLERCRLYVGSDSGLAHLAAAVGTPPITLFAPADPDRVCPFGHRNLVIQPPGRDCPCFLYPWQSSRPRMRCHDATCIRQITVDQVLNQTITALHTAARSGSSTLNSKT